MDEGHERERGGQVEGNANENTCSRHWLQGWEPKVSDMGLGKALGTRSSFQIRTKTNGGRESSLGEGLRQAGRMLAARLPSSRFSQSHTRDSDTG